MDILHLAAPCRNVPVTSTLDRTMGLLCELFVAKHGDALRFERRLEHAVPPRYERGDAKGLLPVSFEVLWAVAERKPFDPYVHTLPDLYFWSHARSGIGRLRQRLAVWRAMALALVGRDIGTSWLHQFPRGFVVKLAQMNDAEAEEIAGTWAGTDDMKNIGTVHARETLNTLRTLARRAEGSGKGLYLWGSV
ncbi:hypothetical protein H8N03_25845 [Ramlibacter sp. USB13]|uniref:Uncharacterized protein n=1 Tax=Ramlibacter cellulosilyticus TaxID=2764187 RepID=A0A923SHY9_9BURK|nr:hypothetical protein [Ramlibacter cellulosilyticus]MBC5786387.1 hypothetical protein [Ramlibacter cellulosilyticus]